MFYVLLDDGLKKGRECERDKKVTEGQNMKQIHCGVIFMMEHKTAEEAELSKWKKVKLELNYILIKINFAWNHKSSYRQCRKCVISLQKLTS